MKKGPNHKINQQWNIQSNELVQVLDESKKDKLGYKRIQ